jgi:hypothetical protein
MMADPTIDKEVEIANRESTKVAQKVHAIKIRKDADLMEATRLVSEIKRLHKNVDGQRKSITAPLRLAIKNTDELFKNPLMRLKDAETIIKEEMLKYTRRVEERAAKKANKLEGDVDAGDLDMADAMAKLNNVKQAETSITTEAGSAQIKKITKIRIVNPAELPPKYFLRSRVIEALRLEVANDVKQGDPVPAGAESYEDRQVAVKAEA